MALPTFYNHESALNGEDMNYRVHELYAASQAAYDALIAGGYQTLPRTAETTPIAPVAEATPPVSQGDGQSHEQWVQQLTEAAKREGL